MWPMSVFFLLEYTNLFVGIPSQEASLFSFVNDANRKGIFLASILYNNTSGWIMCFISKHMEIAKIQFGIWRVLVYIALSLAE